LKNNRLRADIDLRNEKINYKIREHSVAKVPYIFVVGKREAEDGTVAIRQLGSQDQTILPLDEAVAMLSENCKAPF
jgi:threonyl-tRNA synthetase